MGFMETWSIDHSNCIIVNVCGLKWYDYYLVNYHAKSAHVLSTVYNGCFINIEIKGNM